MDSNTGQWFTDFIAENIVNISKGTLGPHYVISIRNIEDISIYFIWHVPYCIVRYSNRTVLFLSHFEFFHPCHDYIISNSGWLLMLKVSSFLLDIKTHCAFCHVNIGHIHELYSLYTFTYFNYFILPTVRWSLRCLKHYSLGLVYRSLTPPLVDFIQTISVI